MSASRTWWRANRWWLAVLPLTIVLCLAASGFRVKSFWWESGMHLSVGSDAADGFRSATLRGFDGHGPLDRTFAAKAGTPREVSTISVNQAEQPVPEDVTAWQIPIEFRADPSEELQSCWVAAFDTEGRQYGGADVQLLDQDNLCLVEGQEGPNYATFRDIPRGVVEPGHERPESWSVEPVILTKAGVQLASVRIWFNYPRYLELPLPQ